MKFKIFGIPFTKRQNLANVFISLESSRFVEMAPDYIVVYEDESADESDLCETDKDDSDVDPTFDLVDVTEKALSNLSIKKTKRRWIFSNFCLVYFYFLKTCEISVKLWITSHSIKKIK